MTGMFPLQKNKVLSGHSPFRLCHFCNREFGSLSLTIHQAGCRGKYASELVGRENNEPFTSSKKDSTGSSTWLEPRTYKRTQQGVHGSLTTMAVPKNGHPRALPTTELAPTREPRPQTTIKTHSVLLAAGHEVPVIPSDDPTPCLRSTQESAKAVRENAPQPLIKRDRFVQCSICGKKYGTKSIAIHQPQCAKKWQRENRTLPPRERRPLPAIACQATPLCESPATRSDMADAYFQYCYAEFEKQLLPCGKCGRKFAPERHTKHVLNCNAEPLHKQIV